MSIQMQPLQDVVPKSLMKAVPMPKEFKGYADDTHFLKSDDKVNIFCVFSFSLFWLQRHYKYSLLDTHDVGWDDSELGTAGCVGAAFISKAILTDTKKHNPTPLMSVVMLDQVELDVMPGHKFIVYHIKAYVDRSKPRFVKHC